MACGLCNARVETKNRVAYEDDLVFVLMNHFQFKPMHVMVLPVRCVGDVGDLTPEESQRLLQVCKRVMEAIEDQMDESPMLHINGASFRTEPQHAHVHILPSDHSLYGLYQDAEAAGARVISDEPVLTERATQLRDWLSQ